MEKRHNKQYCNGEVVSFIDEAGEGREKTIFELAFTDEEKDNLESILLRKFDGKAVARFTRILEELCRAEYRISNLQKTKYDIESDIAELLSVCNKAVKKLHNVSRFKQQLILSNKVSFKLNKDAEGYIRGIYDSNGENEWCLDVMMKAGIARNKMLDFIECFEQRIPPIKAKVGRPSADSSGFVKEIANAYRLCFDVIPTKSSSTFAEVISFALEAVGRDDSKDPTRKIKHALTP